jgi:hypothetical protein
MKLQFNDVIFQEYLSELIGKFFKILPLFEQKNSNLSKYLNSLQFELEGVSKLVIDKQGYGKLVSVLGILKSVLDKNSDGDIDVSTIRSEVFKCMRIIESLLNKGERNV